MRPDTKKLKNEIIQYMNGSITDLNVFYKYGRMFVNVAYEDFFSYNEVLSKIEQLSGENAVITLKRELSDSGPFP